MLEHELDESRGLSQLCRLTLEIGRSHTASRARAAGEVEARTAGGERVVRLPQHARTEAGEIVEHGVAQQLHAVCGKEERHLVTLLDRRPPDEEPERRPARILRPSRDVDQDLGHARIVPRDACLYLGKILARIQICGRVVATLGDRRIERELPGRQGKVLFVYLVCHRLRQVSRAELIEALWPNEQPAAADSALSALLSKIRRVVGPEVLVGRSKLALDFGPAAFVDFEAALEAIHRAESNVRRGAWVDAWAPARIALHTALRGFLHDEDAPWIAERRARLEEIGLRAYECVAEAGIGLGGPELDAALRSGRALVEIAPYRESGYRLLMRALAQDGNAAEALTVYELLRSRLHDDLGAAPAPSTQDLHRALLRS